MIEVTITCPITWWEQCLWITHNCIDCVDNTNWPMWQTGQDYIYFWLREEDATAFKLRFGL